MGGVSRNVRRLILIALAGTLAITMLFSSYSPMNSDASAARNGQQISLNACFGSSATFAGNNQYGQYKVATFSTSYGVTNTNGWWWQGWVEITSRGRFGTSVKSVYVPTSGLDWYYTWGCV